MNEEAQRIAIATACGWKKDVGVWIDEDGYEYTYFSGNEALPDYLNDLNAMNQAESILGGETYDYSKAEYCKNLCELLGEDEHDRKWFAFNIVHATAAQRAEAFLKTIGKWEAQS